MSNEITIIVNEDGVAEIINVPEDVIVHICDVVEDTDAWYGKGNNNFLSQRV